LAGDALEADYHALTEGAPPDWRVAGNLPYRSASAILLRLLMVKPPFFRLVVMVQREVGERLTARPGDEQYGSLSVITAYHVASAATVLRVPRGAFFPQPKVDSVVLSLQPRPTPWPEVLDESVLSAAIRAGFGQRRKQLANALAGGSGSAAVTGGIAAAALAQVGLPPRVRAEELDVHQFIALSNALVGQGVRAGGDG
jgi:16S rRNA (adenine1518-N6/adenine1519-N6)-dimethyltransferase